MYFGVVVSSFNRAATWTESFASYKPLKSFCLEYCPRFKLKVHCAFVLIDDQIVPIRFSENY